MTRFQVSRCIIVIIAATLVMGGCAADQPGRPELIGIVDVDGTNAFLNGLRIRSGEVVRDGDTISTGAGTSMRLRLRQGGYIQLEENTDPRILQEGICILVQIFAGEMFVDAKRLCVESPDIRGTLLSRVNVKVGRGRSELTVIEGSVEMTRPTRRSLREYEQYIAVSGRAADVRRLTREQAEATSQWTKRYFTVRDTRGWCCIGDTISSTTQVRCSEARGRYFADEASARRACPPPPVGWCCIGDRVSSATQARCSEARGRFFVDEASARKACLPPPAPIGWCCIGDKLSTTTLKSCRAAGGNFFTDEGTARRACVIIK